MTNLVNNTKPNINTIISLFPYPSVFNFIIIIILLRAFQKKSVVVLNSLTTEGW
jgi:hypothetical protein